MLLDQLEQGIGHDIEEDVCKDLALVLRLYELQWGLPRTLHELMPELRPHFPDNRWDFETGDPHGG